MHYGEGEDKDAQNSRLINDILDQEKPDLVVITGDVVSGYAWD
jgi:predicted MPP superfamily phosphohydrolase